MALFGEAVVEFRQPPREDTGDGNWVPHLNGSCKNKILLYHLSFIVELINEVSSSMVLGLRS
jgi:hypothetical protein